MVRNFSPRNPITANPATEVRRARTKRMLVLPATDGAGVATALDKARYEPEDIGVTGAPIRFPSGAMLIRVQADKLEAANDAIKKAGLEVKGTVEQKPCEFRVHRIPSNTNAEKLKAALEKIAGQQEFRVVLEKYKDRSGKLANLQIAYCTCTKVAFVKIAMKKTVRLGWSVCTIDTKPQLMRCRKCGLLGHTTKYCSLEETIGSRWKLESNDPEANCADCRAFNVQINDGLATKIRKRDTGHPTRSYQCPTRKKLLRKYLLARQGEADKAKDAELTKAVYEKSQDGQPQDPAN